jgi:hypothetical protein
MSDTIEDARHKKIIHQPDLFSDIRISELQKENKDLKDEINALRRKIENIRVEVL